MGGEILRAWHIFREVLSSVQDRQHPRFRRPALDTPLREATLDCQPQLCAHGLLQQLQGRFEQLARDVAGAVNDAPAGQVIDASEEKGRDVLADFRLATY